MKKESGMMVMLLPEHVMKALKGADDESGEGEPCPRCGKMHGDEEELDEEEMADADEEMGRVDMKKVMEKDRMRRMGKGMLEDDEDDEDYNG